MQKNGNGNGNGHKYPDGWPASVATSDSFDQTSQAKQTTTTESDGFASDEMEPAAADPDLRVRKRRRQRLAGVLVLLLLVGGIGGAALYYVIRRSLKLDVIVGNRRTTATRSEAAPSGENLTQQAVKEMQAVTTNTAPDTAAAGAMTAAPPPPITVRREPSTAFAEGLAGTIRAPQRETSATPGNNIERQSETGTEAAPERAASGRATPRSSTGTTTAATSRRNTEKSIWMVAAAKAETSHAGRAASSTAAPTETVPRAGRTGVARPPEPTAVVPNFGAMLPVRSLGTIYTLRSSTLARFELTRETSGPGWTLPRGTVLVAALKGGEFDRAYLALVGFLDPATGRLVKVSGELLGSDGGTGLKGRRRQLSNRGMRVLAEMGRGAFGLAQSVLAGRNGGTTVIMPGVGAVQPEVSALGGRGSQREFVEVAAGAPAYVMITDLPETIKGVDALAELEPEQLASVLAAGERSSGGTGLTDAELAELLATGSADEIRNALPRMTPAMARVAQEVLNQTER